MAPVEGFLRCYVLLFVFSGVEASFLGGSVSWMRFTMLGGVRFTYRLTWERGTGPCGSPCSQGDLYRWGTLPPYLAGLRWTCAKGCGSGAVVLNDINYIVTSVSTNSSGWEQGEGFFFYHFKGSGVYEVTLEGIPWQGTSQSGRLVTSVDLGIRNDTATTSSPALPNASPIAAVQPTVGIQYSCTSKISIPVSDPDADTIKCRLATQPECGDVCTNLPLGGFILDTTNCTLTLFASQIKGYTANTNYHVTLMAEDYPDYTIMVGPEVRSIRKPISKIPIQFTVTVISDGRPCGYNQRLERFVTPTREDKVRLSYGGPAFGQYQNGVYLKTADISNTEFMISVPAMMRYEILGDDYLRRSDVTRMYFNMTPWFNQSGDTMSCVWGRQQNGLTTIEKRCVTSIMYDLNSCLGQNPCFHGGVCFNLYGRWTCKCKHGYKPRDCSQQNESDVANATDAGTVVCINSRSRAGYIMGIGDKPYTYTGVTCADFPCKNNGTCKDTGTEYICLCPSGYHGLDCEVKNTTLAIANDKLQILEANFFHEVFWPFILGVFVMVILAFVITCCCCWCVVASPTSEEDFRDDHPHRVLRSDSYSGSPWSERPRPLPIKRKWSIAPVEYDPWNRSVHNM